MQPTFKNILHMPTPQFVLWDTLATSQPAAAPAVVTGLTEPGGHRPCRPHGAWPPFLSRQARVTEYFPTGFTWEFHEHIRLWGYSKAKSRSAFQG